ncbi:MAG TPA: type II secretion system protein [Candidatus Xenobia bacterium]|jgi:prepilin-type N-terminal cleavage/methylation domain-containing protein
MRSRRKFFGFTLIELLIVMAIIALLADIMIPNFVRAREETQLSGCESNEKNIATALEMYQADNQGHYSTPMTILTPNYIKVIPTCPANGTDTYSATYQFMTTLGSAPAVTDGYSFYCAGIAHESVTGLDNFPQYNSVQGLATGH